VAHASGEPLRSLITQGDWTGVVALIPGAHVAVLTDSVRTAVEGRLLGLELRDTLLVLRPGPVSGYAFLFRVPIAQTVAAQVLETGTGALHIEVCRVGFQSEEDRAGAKPASNPHAHGGFEGKAFAIRDRSVDGEPTNHPMGRWPPNVLLVHGPGCRKTGTRKVNGSLGTVGALGARRGGIMGETGTRKDAGRPCGYADEDGLEEVPAWECEQGCPVKVMDDQSGILTSGDVVGHHRNESSKMWRDLGGKGEPLTGYGDSGGASRFFPQFKDEDEMRAWLCRLLGEEP
jgi:hypothetical protein